MPSSAVPSFCIAEQLSLKICCEYQIACVSTLSLHHDITTIESRYDEFTVGFYSVGGLLQL
jgi:hypothetical protein